MLCLMLSPPKAQVLLTNQKGGNMSHDLNVTKIAVFQKKQARKTIYNNEWWFVVEDVL